MENCHLTTGAANPLNDQLAGISELTTKQREIIQQLVKMFGTGEIDEEIIAGRLDHVIWHYADLMLSSTDCATSDSDGARIFSLSMLARLFKNNFSNQYI